LDLDSEARKCRPEPRLKLFLIRTTAQTPATVARWQGYNDSGGT